MTATVLLLDPRWPTLIPLHLAGRISGEVAFTPEVPVDVRWALDTAGGEHRWLISTDPEDPEVLRWQREGRRRNASIVLRIPFTKPPARCTPPAAAASGSKR